MGSIGSHNCRSGWNQPGPTTAGVVGSTGPNSCRSWWSQRPHNCRSGWSQQYPTTAGVDGSTGPHNCRSGCGERVQKLQEYVGSTGSHNCSSGWGQGPTAAGVGGVDRVPLLREFQVCYGKPDTRSNLTQSVPRSKHSVSVIQTRQLMLYREIIAVCSQIHTKHISVFYGKNIEF